MESNSIYLRSRIVIQEVLIQAEAQIVFQLGDKGNWYLWEGEREQFYQKKEGISTGAEKLTLWC